MRIWARSGTVGDHHLQRISVDLTGNRILARLRDQNGTIRSSDTSSTPSCG